MNRTQLLTSAAVVAALGAATLAVGATDSGTPAASRQIAPTLDEDFSVFASAATQTEKSRAASIKLALGTPPDGSLAATIDWSRAQAVDGTGGKGWLLPAKNAVCVVITDPNGTEGGVSCNTRDQIAGGGAYAAVHTSDLAKGQELVVVPVIDAGAAPKVTRGGRQASPVEVQANAATAVLGAGDSLSLPNGETVRTSGARP